MEAIFRLAQRGWGVVLGDGDNKINPVHAADIGAVAVQSMIDPSLRNAEIGFGVPETYTQTGIVRLAFRALGKPARIVHVPFWVIDAAAAVIRPFNRDAAGFLKLFRRAASLEAVGTPVGKHSLRDFYRSLARETESAETLVAETTRSRPSGALRMAFRLLMSCGPSFTVRAIRCGCGWLYVERPDRWWLSSPGTGAGRPASVYGEPSPSATRRRPATAISGKPTRG